MIKVGRYKNWREVCKAMGWKTTGGTYKEARKKDLNTLCKCHQEGNAWIVEEVYEVQLERVDLRVNGNNNIYGENLQQMIIDMCSTTELSEDNKLIHMSMSKILLVFNMINENYLIGRDNMYRLSKSREIPIETIYDFYDTSFSNAKQNVIRALDKLQDRFLINYKEDIMLMLKNGGSRIADNDDILLITQIESSVAEEMKVRDKRQVFLQRKWNEFKRKVNGKLCIYSDVCGYYKVITIYTGSKFRNMVLEAKEKDNIIKKLNISMIESNIKSAQKRHEKSLCCEKKYFDKDQNRRTPDYVAQSKELIDITINKKCTLNLANELKDVDGKYTYQDRVEDIYKWKDVSEEDYELCSNLLNL